MSKWTIFSNYGHVLLYLAKEPKARLRDVAEKVGVTERAVQTIVHELQQSGYLQIRKQGRCNQYQVNGRKHLRHSLESKLKISQLIKLFRPGNAKPVSKAPDDPTTKSQKDALDPRQTQQALDF